MGGSARKNPVPSPDEVFEALSAPRHYYRLPQILQALQATDTEFLKERGTSRVCIDGYVLERKRIALEYLDYIETDYGTLIEASRVLAAMAPEVVAARRVGKTTFRHRLSLEVQESALEVEDWSQAVEQFCPDVRDGRGSLLSPGTGHNTDRGTCRDWHRNSLHC